MRQVRIDHKSMHVVLYADCMFCYVIKQTDGNKLIVQKKEYALTPALTASLLYNPTQIANGIKDFIAQHHMSNKYLYITLGKPLMQEQVYIHHKNHADLQELIKPDHQRTYHHSYVGPINEHTLFYVCSITNILLLQLKIICSQLPCYVQAIQPTLGVEYDLYTYLHRQDIARAQIAQKINPQTVHIDDLFTSPAVKALVKNQDITQDDNLIYALGSFVGAHA